MNADLTATANAEDSAMDSTRFESNYKVTELFLENSNSVKFYIASRMLCDWYTEMSKETLHEAVLTNMVYVFV